MDEHTAGSKNAWQRGLRALGRGMAAEALIVSAVAGTAAFLVDGVSVAAARASPSIGLACGLAAASLIVVTTVAVSPTLYAVTSALDALGRGPRATRALRPAVLMACALAVAAEMLAPVPVGQRRPTHYAETLLVLFGAAVLLLDACARSPRRSGRVGGVLVALGALGALTSPVRYSDARALSAVLLVGGALAALAPVFPRVRERRHLAGLLLATVAAAGATAMVVEPLHPGWRASAEQFGRFEPPVAELLRHVLDFDRDGFSGFAWGGDCDDADPRRHPLARESTPGRDQNCNGLALPAQETDADRGLTPPVGDADLAKASIDTVLLVSIDCLRYDAFTPEVMPNVTEFAQKGLVFHRAYASGSRTHVSFPLMQRGSDDAVPVAERLRARGVRSVAVMAFNDKEISGSDTAGFEHVVAPRGSEWWSAPRVTDEGIAALRGAEGPTYLWVHYIDAHDPRGPVPAEVTVARPAGDHEHALYLSEIAWIDRELGRLFATLAEHSKRAVVVVTSDHGEGLGAHGVPYHGLSVYEELVRIPAILVAPGVGAGTYDGLVSHRDLPATVLGAFGFVADDPTIERFGRSWFRLRAAPASPLHEFVVARSDRTLTLQGFAVPQAGLVEGNLKLVRTFEDGLTELYDLAADPAEQRYVDPAQGRGPELAKKLERYRDVDRYP